MWPFKQKQPEAKKQERRRVFVRNYAAAQTDRLTNGWNTAPIPVNQAIMQSLQTLRARSREQYANNDYARRFVGLVKSNVIGPKGITLQANIKDPDGRPDRLAGEAIESAWRDWSTRKNCDIAEQVGLKDIQSLVMSNTAIDGEFLARKIKGRQAGDYAFKLQMLDPELLDPNYHDELPNGNYILMSIEFTEYGKPVAYHILKTKVKAHYQSTEKRTRVPASEIVHLFIAEYPQQVRGVPWMSTALLRMKNLGGYEHAAVVAARVGASKMGFYIPGEDSDGQYEGDETGPEGEIIEEADPGTMSTLPPNWDFKSFNPDYPHQQYGDFTKQCLRGIASGLGVSYNSLANDLEGVNFSSIRAGVLEDREVWKALQEFMIEYFMRELFNEWLPLAILAGKITVNDRPLKIDRLEKYQKVSFIARRWAWVDPLKDTKSNAELNAMNAASVSEIIRDRGRDPDDVWAEIAAERETMRELNIEPQEALNNATDGLEPDQVGAAE